MTTAEESAARTPFDEAQVFFEFNTTDNDLGFQLFLDAEGWQKVTLDRPQRRTARADRGRREAGESRPHRASLRERGALTQRGAQPVSGGGIQAQRSRPWKAPLCSARSSCPMTFSPPRRSRRAAGRSCDPDNTVATFSAPGAEQVEIIIEQEDLGEVYDVILPGNSTRLRVPRQFLRPDTEYKIEILAIGENGNRTIAESTFETEPVTAAPHSRRSSASRLSHTLNAGLGASALSDQARPDASHVLQPVFHMRASSFCLGRTDIPRRRKRTCPSSPGSADG